MERAEGNKVSESSTSSLLYFKKSPFFTTKKTLLYIYIHTHIHMCVCVWCERERERERERDCCLPHLSGELGNLEVLHTCVISKYTKINWLIGK